MDWGRKRLVLVLIAIMCSLRSAESVDALVRGNFGINNTVQLVLGRIAVCIWFSLLGYVLLQW